MDWQLKFQTHLGLSIIELTGDTDIGDEQLNLDPADIICTTPEKFGAQQPCSQIADFQQRQIAGTSLTFCVASADALTRGGERMANACTRMMSEVSYRSLNSALTEARTCL